MSLEGSVSQLFTLKNCITSVRSYGHFQCKHERKFEIIHTYISRQLREIKKTGAAI